MRAFTGRVLANGVEGAGQRKYVARDEQIVVVGSDWMPIDALGGDRDLRYQVGA